MHPLQKQLIQQYEQFVQLVKRKCWNEMPIQLEKVEKLVEKIHPYHKVSKGYPTSYQLYERNFKLVRNAIHIKNELKLLTLMKENFVPLLQKLLSAEVIPIENKYTMAFYYAQQHPKEVYIEERLKLLEEEAKKQSVEIIYLSDEDIKKNKRKPVHVIYNVYPTSYHLQTKKEKILRNNIPFMCHSFGDKLDVPQILIQNPEISSVVIPFIGVTNVKKVEGFLEKHQKGVLKPYRAARGEDIFFIEKISEDNYIVNHQGEDVHLTTQVLNTWIEESLINRGYILQRYVKCLTKEGFPYDMRVWMQKNGMAQWEMVLIYPRIGKGDSILTNLLAGGTTKDIFEFLEEQYGKNYLDIYLYIEKISLLIAQTIDDAYGNAIEEMGLDIAIDIEGNIWTYEANNKPGPYTLAEQKRAKNAIAYAKYLAHHQIFPTNEYQNRTDFDSTTITEAPLSLKHDRLHVGVLIADELQETMDEVARLLDEKNAIGSVFTLGTVDVQEQMIYAKNYINGEWMEGLVPFPQVIIDRVQGREIVGPEMYYSHFENIPMTHTVPAKDFTSLTVDTFLRKDDCVKDYLIAYDSATIDLVQTYIQQYSHIVLRSIKGTSPFIEVKKKSKQLYEMTEGTDGTVEVSLPKVLQFIQSRLEFDAYIVQPYIQHIERDGQEVNFHVQLLKYDSNQPFQLADVYITYDGVRQESTEWDYPVSKEKIERVARKLVDSYIKQAEVQFGYVTVSLTYDERTKQAKYLLLDPFTRTHFEDEQSLLEAQVQYACSLANQKDK